MAAIPINLTLYKGTDFKISLNIKQFDTTFFDLDGYSVAAYMARNYTTSNKISLNPNIINRQEGLVELSLPKVSTNFVTGVDALKVGRYVYDLYLIDNVNAVTDKVISGVIEVNPSVF